ncbi:hypothetical protein GCM10010293_29080 [Streptomyces griseoflavus]|nr:hypothetical protein GCM10010293_29080 [Streptomyces griseoflavus]
MEMSTGAARRELYDRCGPWKPVYERFRRWSADRTSDRQAAAPHVCPRGYRERVPRPGFGQGFQ